MDFSDPFYIIYTSNSPSERLQILSKMSPSSQKKLIVMLQTNACTTGYIDLLIWLNETFNCLLSPACIDLIFEHGHLDIIQWVYNSNPSSLSETSDIAVKIRLDSAIANGHLDFVKWLVQTKNLRCTENALFRLEEGMSKSVEKEKYKLLLEFLSSNFEFFNPTSGQYIPSVYLHLIELSCISGNIEMLKWILSRFPDRYEEAYRDEERVSTLIETATRHSNLHLLEWMYCSTDHIYGYDLFERKYIFRHPVIILSSE